MTTLDHAVDRAADEMPTEARTTPSEPQPGERPGGATRGPSPFLVVGAALLAGFLLARWIDWRGHAHPRR